MAWDASDLAAVEAAIIALASGQRVASITHEGRSITYDRAALPELLKIRDAIIASMKGAAGRPMTTLAQFSKG